ncbi:THAP domain-containing protein 5-like [Conger conger]|uniref:THAP domain-containing protein 5-like n=1 Tax=Conger conger TaxID=82655 RepID=UPI002A5A8F22|nr:THAP domain-containing protein 5-like [Conger conger]
MPRYCAVKLCKNRGGIPSKDNKKISFYPFPLRDEARLQKWVDNMKREEWTPSRHQYLCSDHFTEDSFDLRWGIRYLKHTAVPTIFPFIYEGEATQDEENKLRCKRNVKPGRRSCGVKPVRTSSPPKKRALILRRESCAQAGDDSAGKAPEPPAGAADAQFPTVLLLRDLAPETASSREASRATASLPGGAVAVETASEQPGGERILIASCVGVLGGSDREAEGGSAVTVLCAETAASPETARDALPVATTTHGTVARTTHGTAGPRTQPSGDGSASDDSDRPAGDGENGLLGEHSYSRQNTDKDQLWSKIAGLHLKITQLEQQEEETVGKIGALEALLAHLKRESLVCEEKQKALEDYFTSVFL